MSDAVGYPLLGLVPARHGHFSLESGHHSAMWLDLDGLFVHSERVAPLVGALAGALRAHQPEGVCGPLLGGAFVAQLVALALRVDFYFTERELGDGDGLYRARYHLPPAMQSQVLGKRLAVVDDVMSAGSAARGTCAELRAAGAHPIAVGALLVLGETGLTYFDHEGVPVEAVGKLPYELWSPANCPLCASGVPLEDVASPAKSS